MAAKTVWILGKKRLFGVLKVLGVIGYSYCAYYTVTSHVASFVVLYGDSMQPTINTGPGAREVVLVECLSKKWQQLKLNDIIVAVQPDKPNTLICKRITAMEGDRVPYNVKSSCKYQTVPKGHVWLEGDNKLSSYDSRDFGPLPLALVHSRVVFRMWPPSRMGIIKP